MHPLHYRRLIDIYGLHKFTNFEERMNAIGQKSYHCNYIFKSTH